MTDDRMREKVMRVLKISVTEQKEEIGKSRENVKKKKETKRRK